MIFSFFFIFLTYLCSLFLTPVRSSRTSNAEIQFLYNSVIDGETTWYYKILWDKSSDVSHSVFIELCDEYFSNPKVRKRETFLHLFF
jgi:hypothetical protein